jgi:hypothetical protein
MAVIESAETECMVFTEHFACVRTIELRWFRARELIGLGSARTPKSLRAEGACKSVPATPASAHFLPNRACNVLADPPIAQTSFFGRPRSESELGKCDAMSPVERNCVRLNLVAFKPAAYGFQNAASDLVSFSWTISPSRACQA